MRKLRQLLLEAAYILKCRIGELSQCLRNAPLAQRAASLLFITTLMVLPGIVMWLAFIVSDAHSEITE